MRQRTIRRAVELVGIGLHKGVPVRMRLEPMDADVGIIFYRKDAGVGIPLSSEYVVDTRLATTLAREGVRVGTIEHLLSAVHAYGIDNLRIVLDNEEVPILDGSSVGFCMMLEEAGVVDLEAPREIYRIKKSVRVEQEGKFAELTPKDGLSYDFTIEFSHPLIRRQQFQFDFSTQGYKEEIARARTFGFVHEIQYLQSKQLALGASLNNAIGLDEKRILNPEGLRFKDEFVRHKILDVIGDLSLIGRPIIGAYRSHAGSHHLNHQLVLALLSEEGAYEEVRASELLLACFDTAKLCR